MATNFAADTLKSVISKAAATLASGVAASDSAVAEFRPHHVPSTDAQEIGADAAAHGAPSLPTLSDSAVAELKAAYLAVEQAIGDARENAADSAATGGDTAATSGPAETAKADQPAGQTADAPAQGGTHQPPADPLAKLLADATGETTATVQGVLQQVHAVLRQEHGADAPAPEDGAPATTGTATDGAASLWHDRAPGSSGSTDAAATGGGSSDGASAGKTDSAPDTAPADATPDAGGTAVLWHDHVAAWLGGTAAQDGATGVQDDAAQPGTPSDAAAGNAVWQHHVTQHGAVDTAVTTDAAVVSAVDDFAGLLHSLDLDPMHGHGVAASHLDVAA